MDVSYHRSEDLKKCLPILAMQAMLAAAAPAVTLSGQTGGLVIDYPDTSSNSSTPDGGTATLFGLTSDAADGSAAQQAVSLINTDFGQYGWDATTGTSAAVGNINIDLHDIGEPANDPDSIEAILKATYSGGGGYQWLQMVTTNAPREGDPNPVIDIGDNDPTNGPLYPIVTDNSDGTSTMQDGPTRPKPLDYTYPATPDIITWNADLFLVSVSEEPEGGPTSITVLDGIHWGFRLVPNEIVPPQQPNPSSIQPTPEPTALAGLVPGLLLALRRRERVCR